MRAPEPPPPPSRGPGASPRVRRSTCEGAPGSRLPWDEEPHTGGSKPQKFTHSLQARHPESVFLGRPPSEAPGEGLQLLAVACVPGFTNSMATSVLHLLLAPPPVSSVPLFLPARAGWHLGPPPNAG